MTEEQRQQSLQSKKLTLTTWDKISHYSIVGVFIFVPIVPAVMRLNGLLNNGHMKNFYPIEILFYLVPLTVAFLFYKLQSGRLKFKEVLTTLNREQLQQVIQLVAGELKWHIEVCDDNFVFARTHPSFFSGSWGEQVTILTTSNTVLVNSICDLHKRTSVVSWGRNKRNMKRLVQEIENVSNGALSG